MMREKIIAALEAKQIKHATKATKEAFANELIKKLNAKKKLLISDRQDAVDWQQRLKKLAKDAHDAAKAYQNVCFENPCSDTPNRAAIRGLLGIDEHELGQAVGMFERLTKARNKRARGPDNISSEIVARLVARLYAKHFEMAVTHNRNFSTWRSRASWNEAEMGRATPFDKIIALVAIDWEIEFSEKVLRDVCRAEKTRVKLASQLIR